MSFFNPFVGENSSETIDLSGYAKKEDLVGQKTADGGEIFNNYENNTAATNSHAEGKKTKASGNYSHAEGNSTTASNNCSHAEGNSTIASGAYSHAEGFFTTASGFCSHAEGWDTKASSNYQHVQGKYNVADTKEKFAFIIGNGTNDIVRSNAFAIDWNGLIYTNNNNENGYDLSTFVTTDNNVGQKTTDGGEIFNDYENNIATTNSHAEGNNTIASGAYSHAEGSGANASGSCSHAEGSYTTASGNYSHAEGGGTYAKGNYSHAEGGGAYAFGECSHAEGSGTMASSNYQHVQGKYNIEDTASKFAFIIGNGTSSARSNAIAIDWNGLIYLNNSETGIDLTSLKGEAGSDGREIELQTTETMIQWRYVEDEAWTDLIALSSLKGDIGEQGPQGYTPQKGVDYWTEEDIAEINAANQAFAAEEVAKVVAGAPEQFDTLKEMSDWLLEHEDSAAAMNVEIQSLKTTKANAADVYNKIEVDTKTNTLETTKVDKVSIPSLTQEEYDALTEKTALYYFIKE